MTAEAGKTPGQPAHPLDLAAIAAWTAFYDIDPEVAVRDWPNITPGTREKWRAAVDAALMAADAASLDLVAKSPSAAADGRTPGQAAYEAFQASRAAREPMFLIVAWTHPLAEGAHGDWEAAAQAAIATVDDWDHYHQVVISERDEARDKLAQAEEVVADDCPTFWEQHAELESLRAELDGERRQRLQLAGERDEARADLSRMRELVTEILDTCRRSRLSPTTARIAGWQERLTSVRDRLASRTGDDKSHHEGGVKGTGS